MANKLQLPIMKHLNICRIPLGQGKRVVSEKGKLDKTYNITVPLYDDYFN